jgi:hypothetical protein
VAGETSRLGAPKRLLDGHPYDGVRRNGDTAQGAIEETAHLFSQESLASAQPAECAGHDFNVGPDDLAAVLTKEKNLVRLQKTQTEWKVGSGRLRD